MISSPKYLVATGCIFLLLGIMEIRINQPFSLPPYMRYASLMVSDHVIYYRDNSYYTPGFSIESFRHNETLHAGYFKYWLYGELNINDTQFLFHLSEERRRLIAYGLGGFPGPSTKKTTVYYGPAPTFLDYLLLPAHKKGEWGTKVYAVTTFFNEGRGNVRDRLYSANERIRTIVYACFGIAAFLFFRAYRKFKASK